MTQLLKPLACCLLVLMAMNLTTWQSAAAEVEPVQPDQPHVSITAQNLPSATSVHVAAIAARSVLKRFNEIYPNYDVRPFSMPTIEGQGMDSGPLMAIAAGIPPHVIYVNFRQSATYIAQGFLEPIEILLARSMSDDPKQYTGNGKGGFLADPSQEQLDAALALIRAQVPKPAWPVVYREDESGRLEGEHVWALPLTNQVHALQYRKDMFYDAGLDPEQPPKNWDELIEMARKLTNPEKGQYGIALGVGKYISYYAYEFLGSNGVEAMRKDEKGDWYAAYGNREAAEAVYYMWRLVGEKWKRPGSDKEITGVAYTTGGRQKTLDWNKGLIGMQWGSLSEELISQGNPQVEGIAPIPAPAGKKGAGIINAQMFGVFADATPEQKIAAVRFAWFTTSKEGKRIRTKVFVEGGYGKYVSPLLLKEFGYDRLLKQVPKGWQEVFNEAIETGVPEPYGRNTQNIYDHLDRPIHTSIEMLSKPTSEGGWLDLPLEEKLGRVEETLRASAKEVNERVLGKLPEPVVRRRNITAAIVLALVGICFAWGMFHVWRHFTRVAKQAHENRSFSKYGWGYLILMPGLVLTILWAYIPLFGGLGIAFYDYQLIRDSEFVGLANFSTILYDHRFWESFGRTIYFVTLSIGLGFWPPILLAILLQEIPTDTAKYIYRTIFYLPAVLSGLVVMFLWKNMYGPTESGVLNKIILSVNHLGPFAGTIVKWLMLGCWGSLIAMLIYLPIRVDEMSRVFKALLWGLALGFIGVTLSPIAQAIGKDGLSVIRGWNCMWGEFKGGVGSIDGTNWSALFLKEINVLLGQIGVTMLKWLMMVGWCSLVWVTRRWPIKTGWYGEPLKRPLRMVGMSLIGVSLLALLYAMGGASMKVVIAELWGTFDLKPFRWLKSPEAAMVCVVIPSVWAASGPGCILYLAALKTVPDDLYEAADIDGASNWHKVFYIVVPRLKYLIVIQFVGAVQGAFKGGVEFIMAMTGGGPNDSTNLLAVEIFNHVFMNLSYGTGTAAAWILGALIIGFTAYQLKLLANAEFKAAG